MLDRYLIVEPSRTRRVHNWLEYMTPDGLSAELAEAGLISGQALDAVRGTPWYGGDQPFALIARKQD